MRRKIVLTFFITSGLLTGLRSLAVDSLPISKQLKMTMSERFMLVGVIAAGGPKGGGIAVIRDQSSGRTHTLRQGESIPGTHDAVLKAVARQKAVISSEGRDWNVGVIVGEMKGSVEPPEPELDDRMDSDDDTDVPGLFEKWYQSRTSSVLSPSLDALNDRDGSLPEKHRRPMVIDFQEVDIPDSENK